MTRDYELAFILNPEVNEEQTQTILGRVDQVVANYGGRIVKVNQWGRRRLAYPIERHRDGLYVFIDMILTPETVNELERTLRVSEEVLRHMVKRRDPKVVQKEREDREAREAQVAAASAAASKQAEATNVEPNAEPQSELATPPAATGEEAATASPVAEDETATASPVAEDETATASPVATEETATASPVATEETEAPAALSEEDLANVPPAIDEVSDETA
ncbi:MAG: 30S ribosomal protein S6 [Ktedonobacteraceae bacterium]